MSEKFVCDKSTYHRLKRAQGQMNGIVKMVEDGRQCEDILIQMRALRSSVDRVISLIATDNLMNAINESSPISSNEAIDEALQLLIKSQ